jgi:hypothetical protein
MQLGFNKSVLGVCADFVSNVINNVRRCDFNDVDVSILQLDT